MKRITEKEAIDLLKKYSDSRESFLKVFNHVMAVRKVALRIAKGICDVDMHKIRIGSVLHDIGRFECHAKGMHTAMHGILGGKILRNERIGTRLSLEAKEERPEAEEENAAEGQNEKGVGGYEQKEATHKLPLQRKTNSSSVSGLSQISGMPIKDSLELVFPFVRITFSPHSTRFHTPDARASKTGSARFPPRPSKWMLPAIPS